MFLATGGVIPAPIRFNALGATNEERLAQFRELLRKLFLAVAELNAVYPSAILRLRDRIQPSRRDERQPVRKDKAQPSRTDNSIHYANQYPGRWDWSLGGFTHYGSNLTFGIKAVPLQEAYSLREKMRGVK